MQDNYDFFMKADLAEYVGKWIAICKGSVVSEGDDPKKVFRKAREKHQHNRILLTKVPKETTMIF